MVARECFCLVFEREGKQEKALRALGRKMNAEALRKCKGLADEKGQFMRKLNKKQKKQIAVIAAKKDEDIDLTDMPEVLDWSKAEIGKFYRPPKKPVTIRLDTDIISWLKSYGRGYQTKTNMLLRHAMKSSVRGKANKRRSA